MEDLTLLYVTCPDADEAKAIARVLVDARLVASANILGPANSIYRWQGRVEEAEEVVMVLKTRRDMTVHVSERLKIMHSYEVPCVVSLPIQGGNPDYLSWLHQQVDEEPEF